MERSLICWQAMYAIVVILELIILSATTTALARYSPSETLNKVDSFNGPPANGGLNSDLSKVRALENRSSMVPPRVLNTMMRLTERGPERNYKKGDTIRAYTPLTSRICEGHVVSLFNIRLHPLSEDLRAIELHYYKLPESLRHRGDNFQVVLWALESGTDSECTRIGALDLQNNRRGYQTTDVTSELTDQWNYLPEEARIGISFRTREDENALDNRLDTAVTSVSTRPFILVYTNQRKRSSIGSLHKTLQDTAARKRRSLIPNMDLSNHIGSAMSNSGPEPAKAERVKKPSPALGSDQLSFEYFNDQNKLRRKMQRKRRKHQKQAKPGELLREEIMDNEIPLPASEGRCQRHSLLVNFRDLGWDDFVIAPLVYDATYCDGTCSSTESDSANPESPTNYAAILNVMNTLGVAPVPLPAPCCAPEKMSSMSLLYFDENSDISLKTFTDMIVNSCSCR